MQTLFGMNRVSAHRNEEYEESSIYLWLMYTTFFFFSYHKKMFFKFICLFLLFNCCYLRIISSRFTTINGVINFRFSSHLQMIIFSFCFTFYGYAIVNGEKFVNNLSKRYAIATSCSAHIYVVRRIP